MAKRAPKNEIGTPGLIEFGGYVTEEWNEKLSGDRKRKLYREMRDNDPIVGATFFVIEMLLLNVKWNVEPAETEKGKEVAEFVESVIKDMDQPWSEFMCEVLSMLQYGWSYHEVVYKKRDDGKIGILRMPIRGQNTLDRWEFDEHYQIKGMWQSPVAGTSAGRNVLIPAYKALHFKTRSYKSNPTGRSILRSVIRTYTFKKHIEEVEAIGIERDLAGLPVLYVPPDYLKVDADSELTAQLEYFKKVVREIRKGKRSGLVLPARETDQGKTGFDFELAASAGKRQIDTNAVIQRLDQRIAMSMLAQFILLGSSGAGSYALADTQTTLFTIALQSFLTTIADVLNKQLLPKLMIFNGYKEEDMPKFVADRLQSVSLATIGTYINQLVASGVIEADDELEAKARRLADLPKKGTPRERPENPLGAGRPDDEDKLDRENQEEAPDSKDNKANVRTERKEQERKD